eukprot:gene14182-21545_t
MYDLDKYINASNTVTKKVATKVKVVFENNPSQVDLPAVGMTVHSVT